MKMKVEFSPFVEKLEGEVVNGHLSNAQKCFSDVLDKSHCCCHFQFSLTANLFICWCPVQWSTKTELFHHLLLLHVNPMWLSRPKNWTRLSQIWLLLDLILSWVLFRHNNSSCADTPQEFDEQQRTHITYTTPSHYLCVYAYPLPTDAGELAWPARSWYHTPACQRGRPSLQAFLTFFFLTGCQLIISACLPGAVLST